MSKGMFHMGEFKFGVDVDSMEMREWELEESFREGVRFVGEKRGRELHPYTEKRRDELKRKRKNEVVFSKEKTKVRRSVNRLKERKLARGAYVNDDLTIRPRDYKTYGYETW